MLTLPSDSVRIVQLTDTHLSCEAGGTLLGMDTDHSLQAVIDTVAAERPGIDLVLGTGDLADHGAREAYQRLQDYFGQLPCENFWLPGNHDDRARMEAAASSATRLTPEINAGCWQILLLNSQVPGRVHGCLGEDELSRMENALQRASEASQHTLVCLHHQPVPVGCDWLDQQIITDAEDFWAILQRFPGVKGVLWGHVHQQIDRMRGDIALMASPSTCVQFAPNSVDFRADGQSPGYRWLDLAPDGSIATGVSRVQGVQFTVDLENDGYL